MSKANLTLLEQLHQAVGASLLEKIQSGEAKAADYAAAIRFLSDNGVFNLPNNAGEMEEKLRALLPFQPVDPDELNLQ